MTPSRRPRLVSAGVVALALALAPAPARADDATAATATSPATATASPSVSDWHPAFETDPVDFALGGYALHAFVKPPSLPHWRFGAGVFGLDLPSFLVDLSATDKGFGVKIDRGFGVWANYYFAPSRRGFFASLQIAVTDTQYRLGGEETDVVGLGVIPRIGFQWLPFGEHGVYFSPMLGLATPTLKSKSPTLGGRTYADPIVTPLPAVHVGLEF